MNFIVFMVFVLAFYLGFAIMVSFIADQIIKIVAVIRTPFPKSIIDKKDDKSE
jgi:hypothetical protein